MKCGHATEFHRKSGVAQWRDLLLRRDRETTGERVPVWSAGPHARPSAHGHPQDPGYQDAPKLALKLEQFCEAEITLFHFRQA
jgi:hypothetical protein